MPTQLFLFNQRWRLRRDSYRPAGEPLNPRLHEVAEVAGDRGPKAFILTHHYSASYPSADSGSGSTAPATWWESRFSAIRATTGS